MTDDAVTGELEPAEQYAKWKKDHDNDHTTAKNRKKYRAWFATQFLLKGYTIPEIATMMDNTTVKTVQGWIDSYLEKTITQNVHELRIVEDLKLQRYLKLLDNGVEQGSLAHIALATNIGKERRQLNGINAATQVEVRDTRNEEIADELRSVILNAREQGLTRVPPPIDVES